MSASQYNNPYIYRKDLNRPRIEYPSLFESFRHLSFKHILDSKYLALSALLYAIAGLLSVVCIASPYWFKLVFSPEDGTFGSEAVKRELSIDTGIFFYNEEEFDNLMDINESNNRQSVPRILALAQILEVCGVCSLVTCLGAAVILVFRRFASVTGNILLAFFSTLTGICLLLVFLLAIGLGLSSSCDPYDIESSCRYKDNFEWHALPIYSQRYRIEPVTTPLIKLNWTTYIAIFPAVLVLAASALVWMESFVAYKALVGIRYQQLRTARDPHEADFNPKKQGGYVYQPPVQQGSMSYGMQPVTFQGGPYQYPAQPPANVGFNVGFQEPSHGVGFQDPETKRAPTKLSPPPRRRSPPPARRRSPSPDSDSPGSSRRYSPPPYNGRRSPPAHRRRSPSPPPRRGAPPSVNSSMDEGPYISREIDL